MAAPKRPYVKGRAVTPYGPLVLGDAEWIASAPNPGTRYNRMRKIRGTSGNCPVRNRRLAVKAKYGLSAEGLAEMMEAQGGRCKVCDGLPGKRDLHVDHNHLTGKVRGLLCSQCNVALGMLQEDTDRISSLLHYIWFN